MARGRNYLALKNADSIEAAGPSKKMEIGVKRVAEVQEIPIELMYFKRPSILQPPMSFPVMNFVPQPQPIYIPPVSLLPSDRK